MAKLTFRNINKIYPNGFHAVHDFNLEINNGEFVVFVGPSGCGKSTTLRMIAGLEDISKGEFLLNDRIANDWSPRQRGIAMVFQSYALYPHLSVYDNIAFGLNIDGVDEDVIEQRVMATAKILGLVDYLDRKPRALSGGQRQRVAVGRAIIRNVDIFLMDEPLSNLDAKQRVTMRSEIIQIHKTCKATTVYVTHDQTEAMTMADRIVVMKDGFAQQIGTPKELYMNPINKFVAGFIGEPPMNFVDTVLEDDKLVVENSYIKFDLKPLSKNISKYKNGDKIALGFRPESVSIDNNATGYKLDCTVELSELLGDSMNLYINIGRANLIIKVGAHQVDKKTQQIQFAVPYDSVYLFDEVSGEVIN